MPKPQVDKRRRKVNAIQARALPGKTTPSTDGLPLQRVGLLIIPGLGKRQAQSAQPPRVFSRMRLSRGQLQDPAVYRDTGSSQGNRRIRNCVRDGDQCLTRGLKPRNHLAHEGQQPAEIISGGLLLVRCPGKQNDGIPCLPVTEIAQASPGQPQTCQVQLPRGTRQDDQVPARQAPASWDSGGYSSRSHVTTFIERGTPGTRPITSSARPRQMRREGTQQPRSGGGRPLSARLGRRAVPGLSRCRSRIALRASAVRASPRPHRP